MDEDMAIFVAPAFRRLFSVSNFAKLPAGRRRYHTMRGHRIPGAANKFTILVEKSQLERSKEVITTPARLARESESARF